MVLKKERKSCSACFMSYNQDSGTRINPNYCSYCQNNKGNFKFKGTRKEFQRMCYVQMRKQGITPLIAKACTFSIRFVPHWRNN